MPHTPGPWYVFGNGHCVGGPSDAGKGAGVAMCGMAARQPAEDSANADLIAAAPNMLATLRKIADFANGEGDVGNLVAKYAREAIRKAVPNG